MSDIWEENGADMVTALGFYMSEVRESSLLFFAVL